MRRALPGEEVAGELGLVAALEAARGDRRVGWSYHGGEDIAEALIAAGLARDCPRFGGGRYAAAEVPVSRDLPFPGYCRPR